MAVPTARIYRLLEPVRPSSRAVAGADALLKPSVEDAPSLAGPAATLRRPLGSSTHQEQRCGPTSRRRLRVIDLPDGVPEVRLPLLLGHRQPALRGAPDLLRVDGDHVVLRRHERDRRMRREPGHLGEHRVGVGAEH